MKKIVWRLGLLASTACSFAFAANTCLNEFESHVHDLRADLANCHIQDHDLPSLMNLVTRYEITYLNLNNNELSSEGAASLAKLSQIDHLALAHNPIEDQGAIALTKNDNLVYLDLEDCRLSRRGAAALASIPYLIDLNISHNPIGDIGASALSKAKYLWRIQAEACNINDEGISALASDKNLAILNVADNHFHDQGARTLANSDLTVLDIRHNHVSQETIDTLKAHITHVITDNK